MSEAQAPPSDPGHRIIGIGGATMIGVGAIVGGGVLALAGVAFAAAGPSALLAFVLNGVIALLTASSYAEMSAAFPENGGAYAFTKKVLPVSAAFGVGWILLFASVAAGVLYALGFAAYAVTAADALWRLTGDEPPTWLGGIAIRRLVASSAILAYTLVLTRRKGGTGKAETIGKLVVFVVIILGGVWALVEDPGAAAMERQTPIFAGGAKGLFAAMGYTFIALQGFDIIATVAGEVKDPARTLPRSMFLSLGVALLIYVPLLLVILTVGMPDGAHVADLARERPDTMVADAVGRFMGPVGFWLVVVAAVLSMASALFANLLAASRITFAMATDRTLPRFLGRTHGLAGIPVRGVLTSAGLMAVILVLVPDVGSAGAAASLIFLISFALTHITTLMAKRRMGGKIGPFTVPWFPVLPTAGALVCAALAVFQSLVVPEAGSIAAVWLLGGFVLFFTQFAARAEVVDARSEAVDPRLARLRGRAPLILVPVANPARARALMDVAEILAPPEGGSVLLLSILQVDEGSSEETAEVRLSSAQLALHAAILGAHRRGVRVEALVTFAEDPWNEIVRVANLHRCETVLLGLSNLDEAAQTLPIDRVIAQLGADVAILGSPPGWDVDQVREVLVPVAGAGTHDRLRARLFGGLVRAAPRRITYLRVVPEDSNVRVRLRADRTLRAAAEEEAPGSAATDIVASADFRAVIAQRAAAADLVIVGAQRPQPALGGPLVQAMGGGSSRRTIGAAAVDIARRTQGAVLIISNA